MVTASEARDLDGYRDSSNRLLDGSAAGSNGPPTIDLDGLHEDLAPFGPGH
jgi:hypothetical protein